MLNARLTFVANPRQCKPMSPIDPKIGQHDRFYKRRANCKRGASNQNNFATVPL